MKPRRHVVVTASVNLTAMGTTPVACLSPSRNVDSVNVNSPVPSEPLL